MAVRKVKRTLTQIAELEAGLEFIRKFYPQFWERMSESEICHFIEICHSIYKANPEILAVTTNPGVKPVQ